MKRERGVVAGFSLAERGCGAASAAKTAAGALASGRRRRWLVWKIGNTLNFSGLWLP